MYVNCHRVPRRPSNLSSPAVGLCIVYPVTINAMSGAGELLVVLVRMGFCPMSPFSSSFEFTIRSKTKNLLKQPSKGSATISSRCVKLRSRNMSFKARLGGKSQEEKWMEKILRCRHFTWRSCIFGNNFNCLRLPSSERGVMLLWCDEWKVDVCWPHQVAELMVGCRW